MIRVKICGITSIEDALYCSSCGADALGFIFSRVTPRYVSLSKAGSIISKLDPFVSTVGVFVDEDKNTVEKTARRLNLDILQFHGKETPEFCRYFRPDFKVIKTFFPDDRFSFKSLKAYKVDACLFDVAFEKKKTGSRTISESLMREIALLSKTGRVIVSGGLNKDNLPRILKITRPYAVDVASGVESLPGKKDPGKVREFIKKARSYEIAG